ncbi:restriction endonuclease [Janibacter melonis]|uniref:restriction endonuclease n=1 Tax=Janibacter melonis TaxID=262209 RepID=UPI002044BD77|nr:restriction endonuclease [Janibacter melonis]MCM3554865.1 restriction endonuclease [Janibacter melonis]
MTQMWGIHNDTIPADELVERGFVAIGWDDMGDLREIGNDQAAMKRAVSERYPHAKPGAIPVWAGLLRRFAFVAAPGDLIIAPNRAKSTVNFGRLVGPYEWLMSGAVQRHRRRVEWLKTDVPRSTFPQPALYEIGSAVTMFEVRNNRHLFEAFLAGNTPEDPVIEESQGDDDAGGADSPVTRAADEEPSAARVEQYTRDLVLRTLLTLEPAQFEQFTADLLRATGYRARVTQYSGDGGVDVVAHRDLLGLEGVIKVQCKRTNATMGIPEVNQLTGTLSQGETGLFVSLGGYSAQARAVERQRHDLRLLGAEEIVDLTLDHYVDLPPRWRSRIPLRQVFVVDRDAEGY